jgi:hypothetical protein
LSRKSITKRKFPLSKAVDRAGLTAASLLSGEIRISLPDIVINSPYQPSMIAPVKFTVGGDAIPTLDLFVQLGEVWPDGGSFTTNKLVGSITFSEETGLGTASINQSQYVW